MTRELPVTIPPDKAKAFIQRCMDAYPGALFEYSAYGPNRPISLWIDDLVSVDEDPAILTLAVATANEPPAVPFNAANHSPASLINKEILEWRLAITNPLSSPIS